LQEELVDRVCWPICLWTTFSYYMLFAKDGLLFCSPFGFLTHCSHVSSLVSSFCLLPTPASRSTFYSLSDPAPTSAPSKKIPLWDFPQGTISLVSPFFFFPLVPSFGSYYYFPSLLLFSSGPSWRFIFFSPHLIPSFF
jgi:hypothetical protein